MPAEVQCPSCGQTLVPPEDVAGVMVTCPVCQKSFVVQDAPAVTQSAQPAVWHLFIAGSERLGPLSEQTIIEWIQQGRVGSEDLVWSQGMRTWAPCASTPPFSWHIPRQT